MKWCTLLLLLVAMKAVAQPGIPVIKKDSCYKIADARKGKRFTEWDCGKLAGVVDCNEKLELDEASNTVITVSAKKPFSGQCETCHMNGILERRVSFVNGKQNGTDTTYYASGCPMVIRTHVQGVENGHWTYYYDSLGTVAWEMNYSVGQKHGPQIFYSRKPKASSGDTTKYENYINGVLQGPKVSYNSKGKRTKQSNYVNGLLEGAFLVYNAEGKIIEEINYKQGKRNGISKYYYDDGILLRTESWDMDVKNGEFKTFYYEGFVQVSENYKKGLKEGWFEEFFPDQKRKSRALYKKDVLIEEHVWDESGREIKTFGGKASSGAEDDAVPTSGKKKKEKKPKAKKPKKPKKGEEPKPEGTEPAKEE
jgi:antitoxin component YwqK of YwqJK toxin-antitoxin module